MSSEMADQPRVLGALASARHRLHGQLTPLVMQKPAGTVLIARGSSDHAAVYGRYLIEAATKRPVALAAPSLQTHYGIQTDYSNYLVVAISQSGQTPEVVTLASTAAASGAVTVAITNHPQSELAAACDVTIDLKAGQEWAVPATKTFTAELAALAILTESAGLSIPERAWLRLPQLVQSILEDPTPARHAAALVGGADRMFSVARGFTYCIALEAALKIKETTSVLAEGYSVADLRHGPIAAIDKGVPLIAFKARGPTDRDIDLLLKDVRLKGATAILCAPEDVAELPLPGSVAEPLMPILAAVRAQQVAYHLSLDRGLDPDSPEGLSKVTMTR